MSADPANDPPMYEDPGLNELARFLLWCNGEGYVLCRRRAEAPGYAPAIGGVFILIERYRRVMAARDE